MHHLHHLLARLLLSIACLGLAVPAAVAGTDIRWLPVTDSHGLTVNMPRIDHDVLSMHLRELQNRLEGDQLSLGKRVEQTRMKGKSTILAAILPGGLIYTAYKKTVHHRAVTEYEQLETQLAELDQDLANFRADNSTLALSRLR
ncbi:hypothetical protein [Sulfuriflexus sp.]|uniref:hypothetical protein n=1 Tax=Sulfuriflexus sp. TaxID=2015443 RepID=UPI0028CBC48F|nr:hypothetical protein [Sulfuriflexus sp.]MDT8405209.1 hypothetical protein [Sulfuriflexus sp.]